MDSAKKMAIEVLKKYRYLEAAEENDAMEKNRECGKNKKIFESSRKKERRGGDTPRDNTDVKEYASAEGEPDFYRDVYNRIMQMRYRRAKRALEALTDKDRKILTSFYVERKNGFIFDLCDELSCERTTIYRMKDRALESFIIAMGNVY